MNKFFLSLILVASSFIRVNAQDYVLFYLQPNGAFLNQNGETYTVVEYDGKSALELYNMVKNNVMSLYNDPKSVMSENEPEMISIHGFHDKIWYRAIYYGGNYKLTFRFKDGKIRVDSPSVDRELVRTSEFTRFDMKLPTSLYFSECAKKCCNSDSSKNQKRKKKVEDVVNLPINYLLGKLSNTDNNQNETDETDDDW